MPTYLPQPTPTSPVAEAYGRASHYDFDNPAKWVTVPDVPLLDEHEMTSEDGDPVAYVDRSALEQIASNNNKRVLETGDPATLILGHTSDDPRAPEKPAKGFVVNYKVKPFRRDPRTGQVVYAIHGDYKVRPRNAHLIEEFPRRSVELWWNKKELDPIAMLGGTTPERDLSVVIRKKRISNVCLGEAGTHPGDSVRDSGESAAGSPEVIRFRGHGDYWVENYSVPQPSTRTEGAMPRPKPIKYNSGFDPGPKLGQSDAYSDPDEGDDLDAEPSDSDGDDLGEDTGTDPAVAKLLASKEFQAISSKVDMIYDALMGDEQGQGGDGDGGGDAGADGMGGPGADGGMGAGPGAQPGGMPGGGMEDEGTGMEGMDPDEEARTDHGEEPVRFDHTGFPGPGNTSIPGMSGTRGSRPRPNVSYARNGSKKVPQNPELIKMKRQYDALASSHEGLLLKLARKEAEAVVNQLEQEGILFGDTPEEARTVKAEEAEFLALLDDEDKNHHVNNVIRKRYRRRAPNPTNPGHPGVARYSRDPLAESPESADDFTPSDAQEASDFADLQTGQNPGRVKMSRADAKKFLLKRRRERQG